MRIVFVGATRFSLTCLQEVLRQGGEVVGVLGPRAEWARFNSDFADLAPVAAARGIPFHAFQRVADPETVKRIGAMRPDVIFVFGLSQLIPKELLALPPKGVIGAHPALLPLHRGCHPLIWAIVENPRESGLTFLYLDEGVDSGDILWQKAFPIGSDIDAADLYQKIEALAREAIAEFLPALADGTAPRRVQDHARATYWPKRSEADGKSFGRRRARPFTGWSALWPNPIPGPTPSVMVARCRSGAVRRPELRQVRRCRAKCFQRMADVCAFAPATGPLMFWNGKRLPAKRPSMGRLWGKDDPESFGNICPSGRRNARLRRHVATPPRQGRPGGLADHDAPLRAQWKPALVRRKTREVNAVARAYGTRRTHRLSYPAAGLDAVPLECLVSAVRSVLFRSRLDTVYMVHHGDVHPDHRVTYQAAAAATKAFRMKGLDVSRVLSFETISSTEAAPPDRDTAFLPTVFHDISPCLEGKLRVMRLNASEVQEDPSPRGLSAWRGAAMAVEFAETFYLGRSLE